MEPLTVHVSAAHDKVPFQSAGHRGSNRDNPVARAMSAATKHPCYVGLGGASVPGRFYAALPELLAQNLAEYGRTGELEPFAFVLCGQPGAYRILAAEELAAEELDSEELARED